MPAPIVEATSGALGSLLTCVLLYPIDLCKTRIQSGRSEVGVGATALQIVRTEGAGALLAGLSPKALHTTLQNFLYFYSYEYLKRVLLGGVLQRGSFAGNTLCGVGAGISNMTVTLPLEALVVRAQNAGGRQSLADTARELLREGPASMWMGFTASSILTLNPAINFAIFDALKARALALLSARAGRPVRSLSAGRAFLLGSLSKVVATLVTYPLIRTKVMMQAAAKGAQEGEPRPTMAQTLLKIIRTEGAAGLYRGCGAQIATAVSKSGILLMSKEQLARYALALILLLRSHRSRSLAQQSKALGLAPSA